MSKQILTKLIEKNDLTAQEAQSIFESLLKGDLSPAQIAALLIALKMKGETEIEIASAALVIRRHAQKIKVCEKFLDSLPAKNAIIDTCGTGGSGLNKFNVSTAAAFVVSAAGASVAKHGNKAMSSTCGSADVLEALGINVNVAPALMQRAINEIGMAFLYAPLYHPALRLVASVRKELGVRTIFNILGPLSNPAQANYQLLGVYSPDLVLPLARALRQLEVKKALVVYSRDSGDEISLSGPTAAAYLNGKKISSLRLMPSDFGLKKISPQSILAKDAKTSARMIEDILKGKKGAPRDMVLASVSACLYLLGLAADFKQGTLLAGRLIDEGKALDKFKQFKDFLIRHA